MASFQSCIVWWSNELYGYNDSVDANLNRLLLQPHKTIEPHQILPHCSLKNFYWTQSLLNYLSLRRSIASIQNRILHAMTILKGFCGSFNVLPRDRTVITSIESLSSAASALCQSHRISVLSKNYTNRLNQVISMNHGSTLCTRNGLPPAFIAFTSILPIEQLKQFLLVCR